MTHFKTILATLTALSTVSTAAFGGTGAPADPNLPKEVAQMHCLVGEWRGTIAVKMGDAAVDLQVSMSCEATSAGFGVLCKSRFEGMPTGVHEETDLFGYDPHQKKYHWFAVSNGGETHDHVADVPTTSTIRWLYRGKLEGKPFTESISMTFNKAATAIRFENNAVVGGANLFSMKGTIRKR